MVNEDAGGSGKYTILYKAQPLNKSDREDHRTFKAEVSHRLPQAGVIRQGPSATLKGKENLRVMDDLGCRHAGKDLRHGK